MIVTVKRGDTLRKLASQYSTTVAAIAAQNGIKNVNLIRVGQRLTINESQGLTPAYSFNPNPINSAPFSTGSDINAVSMRANATLIKRYAGQNSGTIRAGDNPIVNDMPVAEPSFFDKYSNYLIYGGGALIILMVLSNSGKGGKAAARKRK